MRFIEIDAFQETHKLSESTKIEKHIVDGIEKEGVWVEMGKRATTTTSSTRTMASPTGA
jgi:hypothetical protein